jgi:hypothetical protein
MVLQAAAAAPGEAKDARNRIGRPRHRPRLQRMDGLRTAFGAYDAVIV